MTISRDTPDVHDVSGNKVDLRDYVERIFDEREKAAEFSRATLERALVEARTTTERAMQEARDNVAKALVEAKVAADERSNTMQKRIDTLESGGAPFASRLDDSITRLKGDVDTLKEGAVRQGALDALRQQQAEAIEQQTAEIKQQRKQIRNIFIAAGLALGSSLVLVLVQLLTRH